MTSRDIGEEILAGIEDIKKFKDDNIELNVTELIESGDLQKINMENQPLN